jgi:hypothetical protein
MTKRLEAAGGCGVDAPVLEPAAGDVVSFPRLQPAAATKAPAPERRNARREVIRSAVPYAGKTPQRSTQ